MILTSRPSYKTEASLLRVEVGVPTEATDAVPLVDVVTDEPVVDDIPDLAPAAAPVETAVVADPAPLTATPTLPHNCAEKSITSMMS